MSCSTEDLIQCAAWESGNSVAYLLDVCSFLLLLHPPPFFEKACPCIRSGTSVVYWSEQLMLGPALVIYPRFLCIRKVTVQSWRRGYWSSNAPLLPLAIDNCAESEQKLQEGLLTKMHFPPKLICRCFESLLKIVKYSPNISWGFQTCVNVQRKQSIQVLFLQWINDHMKLFCGFGQQKENVLWAFLISLLQESRWHWEHFPQCSFNYGANSLNTGEDGIHCITYQQIKSI